MVDEELTEVVTTVVVTGHAADTTACPGAGNVWAVAAETFATAAKAAWCLFALCLSRACLAGPR